MSNEIEIDCAQAAAALYEVFKAHPVLSAEKPRAIAECETQAVLLIYLSTQGDWRGWDLASADVRGTATALLMDFMAKLRLPESSAFSLRRWRVPTDSSVAQGLAVAQHEMLRSHSWLQDV